ncbi:MAG: hypothetical protein WC822_02890 [Candidatus Paceibacterota bacterium]|jgi:hypothetical protein
MEKIKMFSAHNFFKILKWAFLILVGLFLILIIGRVIYRNNESKTNDQVVKIHNTKLTLDDVMGVNLPPDPGVEADKTVQGIDANQNGIRDDVELAVFKEYPNSAKTRAVLLQYALALQMEVIQPMVNEGTVIAVAQEGGRAYLCIGEILIRNDDNKEIMDKYFKEADFLTEFVDNKQINTKEREQYQKDFYKKIGSYNSLDRYCDIDYSKLPN